MKRTTVVAIAILGLVLLEAVALMHGINGTLFRFVVGAIAGMVGWLFGKADPGTMKRLIPAAVLAVGLASCKGADGKPPAVVVEACAYTQKYGKICATYDGSTWKFTADVELPPDLLGSAGLDDLLRKLKSGDEK